MRLNRGGLIACAIYTLHFAIFFSWALFSGVEASAFLASIAVFPAGLFWAGMGALLGTDDFPFSIDSWLNSIPVYYIEGLLIFYLVGWAISALTKISSIPDDTSAARDGS